MNRTLAFCLTGVGLAGFAVAVFAQSVEGLDIQAIEARGHAAQADAQELFDFATARSEAHRSEAQGVVDAAKASVQVLDVSDMGGVKGPIDFDAIVTGAKAGNVQLKGAPLFIAFASLSMPEDALARLIADTTKAGGVVVFRGFSSGNPQAFITGIRKVVDQAGATNVAIDPRLFRSLRVDRVPTFVALSTDFEPCDQLDCVTAPPPHDRIAGNVSVAYVLETFADANGPGARVSRVALANMRTAR